MVEKPRPGRPTQLTPRLRRQLWADLQQSPEPHGLPRAAWDGPTLTVHLRRRFGVHLKVRQAQNWLHRLGYRLTRPGYVYLQARAKEAEPFRRRLKKLRPLRPRDVLVFEDETGFSLPPASAACGPDAASGCACPPAANTASDSTSSAGWPPGSVGMG